MSTDRRPRHRRSGRVESVNGIEVKGLSKTLRGREIFRDVDLVVPRGSVAVIEGENGAGKTTMIRILATVVSPDAGSVRVNGYDAVAKGLQVRRSIGVSFANERSLYWRINAFQNLELFGKIAGLKKKVIRERSAALIDELRLGSVAGGWVSRMSTGQRQRLMVARALLTDPTVVLLDEPFRGLDEEGLHTLLELVANRSRNGTTILIVAPLIEAVLSVADRTYQIEGGTLRGMATDRTEKESVDRP